MNNSPAVILFDTDGNPVLRSDSFGRLKVANQLTLFDGNNLTDNSKMYFVDLHSPNSTIERLENSPISRLTIGTQANEYAIRQTRQHFSYQAGKAQIVLASFCFGNEADNLIRRVGIFSESNGIFLEQNDTGVRFVIRTNTSGTPADTNFADQQNWNMDTMDGYGPSGIALDLNNSQILYIEYQWLGVGTVKLGFNINGVTLICHEFHYSNMHNDVYMATPNLPVRYEIRNTSATSEPYHLDSICCSVSSEGGNADKGITCAVDRADAPKQITVANGTLVQPLIQVRLKESSQNATAVPENISVHCIDVSQGFRWILYLNPVFDDESISSDFTHLHSSSLFEKDISNNSFIIDGHAIASGYGFGDAIIKMTDYNMIPLGQDVEGNRDIYCLAIQPIHATNEKFVGAIRMRGIS